MKSILGLVLLLLILFADGCKNPEDTVLSGTYYDKADIRRSQFAEMMVIPGKLTVLQFEAWDQKQRFNKPNVHDLFFVRFPEEVKVGLVLTEDFKSATAYFHCYSSFTDWRIDKAIPSKLEIKVLEVKEGSLLLEIKLDVEVVSPRKELKFLETNRRVIKGTYRYLLTREEISRHPILP